MYRSATYDFLLLTFHSKHGPISYRFQEKWQFRSKIAKIFPNPVYFVPPFPLELGTIAGVKKLE